MFDNFLFGGRAVGELKVSKLGICDRHDSEIL